MQTKKTYYSMTALLVLALTACASEQIEGDTEVGQLELPLTATGSNGTRYVLDGQLRVEGPEIIVADLSDEDPTGVEPVLVLNPRVGGYTVTLSNWSLQQMLVAGGPLTPVTGAVLVGSATRSVVVRSTSPTTVTYELSVPGTGTIVFARGTLNIDFLVEQGFPAGAACTTAIECASQVCRADDTCAAASCTDGVQNGTETSPDCGPTCMCGGGATACTAAQNVVCMATDICTVVAGMVQCTPSSFPALGTPCTAAELALCPANTTSCAHDGMGGILCTDGGDPIGLSAGATCDPTRLDCRYGLSCQGAPAVGYTCQPASLPAGAACTGNSQCVSGMCRADTNTCG